MTFSPPTALLDRLSGGTRPVVFLIGSAVTQSFAGKPGVCNVQTMIGEILEEIAAPKGHGLPEKLAADARVRELQKKLDTASEAGSRYQTAFQYLKDTGDGAASINAVIRKAVLRAWIGAPQMDLRDTAALARCEQELAGWHLGPAVKALGLIAARHPQRFGRIVLTTNFDPLIEIAIRSAGRLAHALELLGDGALSAVEWSSTGVAHLHGLWRSDTLHTHGALMLDRPTLRRSLAALCREATLVAVGYGGWDDVLIQTLKELSYDKQADVNIAWCFFESNADQIRARYPKLLGLFQDLRERVSCYAGVDCSEVLPALRSRLDGECSLIGRGPQCSALLDAIHEKHGVELIGERCMQRSELLAWATEHCGRDAVAHVCARELPAPTPAALVRRVAKALGRADAVETKLTAKHALPDADDAVSVLDLLHGVWLIDDAEALAQPGHGFTPTFFSAVRARVQTREIQWISVTRNPLRMNFRQMGLDSEFLNDTKKIYVGGLDPIETDTALSARLGARAERARRLAGTLPRLVSRLCQAEWEDVDATLEGLGDWGHELFDQWWKKRDAKEQELLRRAVHGVARKQLGARQRDLAVDLCRRGLLVETVDGYELNGEAWRDHVSTRR